MQPAQHVVKPHTSLFVHCPVCNSHKFQIDHMIGKLAGPWYCGHCGAKTTIDSRDYAVSGEVLVTSDTTSQRVWLICELEPQTEPVRIAYEVLDFTSEINETDDEREGSHRYFVEEHQCPTNITSSIEAVFVGRDDDAHGIFRYLKTVPRRVRGVAECTGNDTRWVEQHAPGLLEGKD